MMHWLYGMTGLLHVSPPTVIVERNLPLSILLLVPKVYFVTMKFVISLQIAMLTEVCHNVSVEPNLQPLSGESFSGSSSNIQDGARLDIAASGCWGGNNERTFFDARVFNPHAPSNRCSNIYSCYKKHERIT